MQVFKPYRLIRQSELNRLVEKVEMVETVEMAEMEILRRLLNNCGESY